ncbi:hypothetical protein GCM10023149_05150 [Mucilaginibacter gynuensis]|uniref:Response regulatory domain-containing protein n=1 Tax=Mucilaginibacter gynuensis TaxID=1302236 RepID=A0ABP8FT08_9SPHI
MLQNILIVDDQPEMLELMKDILEPEGFAVTTLVYVDDIVSCVTQHQPDLVILDHLLAGVNGGELCREIKNHPLTAALPVILLSGFPRLREAFGDFGSDAFIAKPFDINTLINTVKSYLADGHMLAHA